METAYLVLNIFRMPLPGPPFPRAPYRYSNCGTSSPITPVARNWCHDRAVGCHALRRGGHCDRSRVPRVRGHARATCTRRSDAGRADCAFSRRRRALALRAHPLAEVVAMTRSQRSVHRLLWPVLAFAVALGFAMALTLRPPPHMEAPHAAEELRP